jgi:hypothetical protein
MAYLAAVAILLLGFTWVGYPLLVRVLASRRRVAPQAGPLVHAESPMVAVLVASRDAP